MNDKQMHSKNLSVELDKSCSTATSLIIDDVDISKCEYRSKLLEGVCTFYGRCANTFCPYKANWLKEQLKAKEQECEELKEQLTVLDDEDVVVEITVKQFEEYKKLKAKNEDLKFYIESYKHVWELDKLKQTLAEIKKIVEEKAKVDDWLALDILQKINECEER